MISNPSEYKEASMKKRYHVIPVGYEPKLSLIETEKAIKELKDFFEKKLAEKLNLLRVTAPMFIRPESGMNDTLNDHERPVSFDVPGIGGDRLEMIISQAKWKRMALYRYGFKEGEGLYTETNSIRRDEVLDNLHSLYVAQWDWEKIIQKEDRSLVLLKETAQEIFQVLKDTEAYISSVYPQLGKQLPEEIFFITAQELEDLYPELEPAEREELVVKEKGAVFVMKIGAPLKSGKMHTHRAPDYDDWELNGDILLWYPVIQRAVELSSMGVRVDANSLEHQLEISGCEGRRMLPYHQLVLSGKMPDAIGGGFGQSRISMFFLQKAHIGEVQCSVWPDEVVKLCAEHKIPLL